MLNTTPKDHCEGVVCPSRFDNFGKTGVQISALGLGKHHIGGVQGEKSVIEAAHRALDGEIIFYDNAWEYYRGETEARQSSVSRGREKAFAIIKVCTYCRNGCARMQLLEQSLRRLLADHLDLWQVRKTH